MSRLLAAGADPNLANLSGFTALDVSLGAARRTLEAVTTHLTDPALLQVVGAYPSCHFLMFTHRQLIFCRGWKLLLAASHLTSCLLCVVEPALEA